MNVRKSLTLAEKSYSYLKKLKIIFMKKMAHVGFEPHDLWITSPLP